MSFGSPTPVEVAVQGLNLQQNREHAEKTRAALAKLPFLRDLQSRSRWTTRPQRQQSIANAPASIGLTMSNVARSLLTATSSSRFVEPNYWRDPVSGNALPDSGRDSPEPDRVNARPRSCCRSCPGAPRRPRSAMSRRWQNGVMPGMIERYNGQRVVSMTANLHGITLGAGVAGHPDARSPAPARSPVA